MIVLANAKTFQSDLHLPALPFPKLKNSIDMYLEILNAIMPNHLFLGYKESIERFVIEESYLLELHQQRSRQHYKNWLENWWISKYHLNADVELIPFSNICAFSSLHDDTWGPDIKSSIERAARYLHGLLIYWSCLRQEIIAPERSSDGEMLTMNMYRSIFNASRIPSGSGDVLYRYFKTVCEGDCPSHIILSIQGFTFKVNFVDKEVVMPVEKIESVFKEITEFVIKQESNTNLSPVTSLPKSQLFSAMSYSQANNEFIENIKTSILWFSFDDGKPATDKLLMSVIGADSENRCGIKSFSIIVFANGLIGINADSALIDPTVVTKIIQFTDHHVAQGFTSENYPLKYKYLDKMYLNPKIWTMYDFDVPKMLQNEILYIRRVFNMKSYQLDCGCRRFKWFNLKIARAWKVNPCIAVHLLILLTYYEIHRSFTTSCAVVSHRKFYRGRQDVVPTVTVETINWIKAVASKNCTSDKLKIFFVVAHRKLEKMINYCENNCGPVLHLNFINSFFSETSKELQNLCDTQFWHKTGFSDKFEVKTFYLGNNHTVAIIPPSMRHGYTFSYSVTEESTLLTVVNRSSEEHYNQRLPQLFLKEFLTSVELLNQTFLD